MPDVCGRMHKCLDCGKDVGPCQLPPFACPWINEDELQLCEDCEMVLQWEILEAQEKGEA